MRIEEVDVMVELVKSTDGAVTFKVKVTKPPRKKEEEGVFYGKAADSTDVWTKLQATPTRTLLVVVEEGVNENGEGISEEGKREFKGGGNGEEEYKDGVGVLKNCSFQVLLNNSQVSLKLS